MTATNDSFQKNVLISLGAHAIAATFILVRAVVMPNEPIEIRKSIRVDIVGLPEKIEQLVPPEPAKEPVKELPPKVVEAKPVQQTPAPKVNLDRKKADTKQAQERALERIKQMSALDKIKSEVQNQKASDKARPRPVAGNTVSSGNSLTGLDKIEYDRYFDELEARVRSNWNIPQWLAERPLRAQIRILINGQGYVVRKILMLSSGNEIFDTKVAEAIDSSSPFPAPPARLEGLLATGGVTLNFPE